MAEPKPTIRGIFLNSHIRAVEHARGPEGLAELRRLYGRPLKFRNTDEVPVRDEVRLITCALRVMRGRPIPKSRLAYEAGWLHFTNFATTPFARIVFSAFRRRFKTLMLNANNIAGHVFRGVVFRSEDIGPKAVRVTMENNDYPIDHFRGLFAAWMAYSGYRGQVTARRDGTNRYVYTARWQ